MKRKRPYTRDTALMDSCDRDFLIWLAGFFDGEGTVVIHGTYYLLQVHIYNCNQSIMRLIHSRVGCGLIATKRKNPNPRHSPSFNWYASGNKAAHILELMRPFLKVKHQVADIAIEFQRNRKQFHGTSRSPDREAEYQREKQWREEMRQRIKALNQSNHENNHLRIQSSAS